MDMSISISENFDHFASLAKKDPDAFEAYRKKLIEKTIEDAPRERRTNLQRYQWRIDQETRKHDNSLGACIKLTQMMSQRMFSINKQLDTLTKITAIDISALNKFQKVAVKSLERA